MSVRPATRSVSWIWLGPFHWIAARVEVLGQQAQVRLGRAPEDGDAVEWRSVVGGLDDPAYHGANLVSASEVEMTVVSARRCRRHRVAAGRWRAGAQLEHAGVGSSDRRPSPRAPPPPPGRPAPGSAAWRRA